MRGILSFFGELFASSFTVIGIAIAALLLIITFFTYAFFASEMTSKEDLINRKTGGVVLVDRNNQPFYTLYETKTKNHINLDQVPEYVQNAIVAIEDRDFYKHRGISFKGIARAIITNIKKEEFSTGGSTITQQVVKNTLLTQEKTILRKLQEIILAIEMEKKFSKKDILEIYLNTSYFGEGAYGIEDASYAYFGKSVSSLTLAEGALLAGILPAPSRLSPISGDRQKAFNRQKLVLKVMEQQGYITKQEEEQALQQLITFQPAKQVSDSMFFAPHFALMVQNELIEKYGEQRISHGSYTIKTTLDLQKQRYAENVVENHILNLRQSNVTNGAAVIINPKTGEILALVGSYNWNDPDFGKVNMVLRPRQPGSAFKPIVYAKAIEDRLITPATVIEDKETVFPGGYKPKNYDGIFRGTVLARFALAQSLNIPAVHVLNKVGIYNAINFAERLGITSLENSSDYGLSLVLGSAEIPLLELTSAYGVFANEGKKVPLTTILEIKDAKKNVIYSFHQPYGEQVMSKETAFIISSILSDEKARYDVFGNLLTISFPAAVKTGTTNDFRDALTVGYTSNVVIGVWVGNNDYSEMTQVGGVYGAAPIWKTLMESFKNEFNFVTFIKPPAVEERIICRTNGLLAKDQSEITYTEYFLPGTAPTEYCEESEIQPSITPSASPIISPTESNPSPTDIDVTPKLSPSTTLPSSPMPTISPALEEDF